MYGFIYNTLRNLIVENHGLEAWRRICDEAEVTEIKDVILDRHYYDESFLQKIGMAASEKLGVSLEKLLEQFGAFFFITCKKSGHSNILRTLGHNLYGFLLNLDTLHDHLSFTYTQMRAPSFRCEKTGDGLTLHYHSYRPGLSNIVLGIVNAVAKDFYQLDISIEQVSYEETSDKLPHHYVFSIEVLESAKNDNYLERLTGDIDIASPDSFNTLSPLDEVLPSESFAKHPLEMVHNSSQLTFSIDASASGCPIQHMLETSGPEVSPPPRPTDINMMFPGEARHLIREQMKQVHSEPAIAGHMPRPFLPTLSMSRLQSRRGSLVPVDTSDWPINLHLFQLCFPFHMIFDKNLSIRYLGISMARLIPKAIANGALITDYFALDRPKLTFNYKNIYTSLHNSFVLCTKQDIVFPSSMSSKEPLYFRGQMVLTSKQEGASILFLCSPRVNSVEELEHQGLYLSDIPVHDVTRDLLLLNRHFRVEMNIASELEQTKMDLEIQKARVEQEKHRADELLHTMLPPSVASQLQIRGEATAINYSSVTILFSDIKGFTTICNSCQPMQVVGMLNSLYTLFDIQSEKHKVYKVETIGDAYMVAAGLLDTPTDHAQAVTNMAFGMMMEAGEVMEPNNQTPLQVRIGLHTGPVVAGVVGRRMPRYCLFGDTVNTASRMESHGLPGKVHISGSTCRLLEGDSRYNLISRGMVPIKGLGVMETYFVESLADDVLSSNSPSPVTAVTSTNKPATASTTTGDTAPPVQVDQCRLVKLPSRTRQSSSTPFSEEESRRSGLHRPVVVDMVKPQPLEEAWTRNEGSEETGGHSSSQRQQPKVHHGSKVTPVTEETEEELTTDADTRRPNPSLFVRSNSEITAEDTNQKTGTTKSRCVLC